MGDNNFYNYIITGERETETYRNDKELLLIAFKQALETAVQYFPLERTENFLGVKNSLSYKNFSHNPYRIINVDCNSGYKVLPTEIIASGNVTVTYYYLPVIDSISQENPLKKSPVSTNTLAYGVLSEFLVYKGRFEEAVTYFEKFINGLKNASNYKRKNKLKAREWF